MRERLRRVTPLAGLAIVWAVQGTPATGVPPPGGQAEAPPPGYVLPGTETWDLSSAGGEAYRIFVSRPRGEAPADGYPVLYVLDGNAHFAGFAEARRIQEWQRSNVGRSIVVAIGYPTDEPYDTARRQVDLTSPVAPVTPGAPAPPPDTFLDFLLNRLRPEVAKRYPVNPLRQSLFGHSFGGLFALHVLYTRPDAFSAIIAASPSQWWNGQAILAEERAFAARLADAKHTAAVSRLLVLVGEREESTALVWDAEALARRLQPLSAFGLRSRFEAFADETHITVPSRAVTTTLRFAFGPSR